MPKRKLNDDGNAAPAQKRRRLPRLQQPRALPLTTENLQRWEASYSPASAMAPPSSSGDTGSRKSIDNRTKLEAHGIHVDSKATLPDELVQLVQSVICASRETTPSAARIADNASSAMDMSEQGAIDLISLDVLFRGEKQGGKRFIATQPKLNLNSRYLPRSDSFERRATGPLSQAQPDTTIGYVTRQAASRDKVPAPLSWQQEFTLVADALTTSIHFPFLTCQWKGYTGNEGQYHASLQSARDGVCIVNYLHQLYTDASQPPSIVDTCHFSATCNMDTIKLWVHWREVKEGEVHHYMECIKRAFLETTPGDETTKLLVDTRKMLNNIQDHALGERLTSIKGAIDAMRAKMEAAQVSRPAKASSKTGSQSSSQPSSSRKRSAAASPPSSPPKPRTSSATAALDALSSTRRSNKRTGTKTSDEGFSST